MAQIHEPQVSERDLPSGALTIELGSQALPGDAVVRGVEDLEPGGGAPGLDGREGLELIVGDVQ